MTLTPKTTRQVNELSAILIAGPTASGKTALSLKLAERYDSLIINADALQVYQEWDILTARPSAEETAKAPHSLFGHIPIGNDYSVGHWLREVSDKMVFAKENNLLPIIVGGTGLYFQSLLKGLANIPRIENAVKDQADNLEETYGLSVFKDRLLTEDPKIMDRIDINNPMRTRRAWEVLHSTGQSLSKWQDDTPPPLVVFENTKSLVLESDTDWLNERIERRFDIMMNSGALDECQNILNSGLWNETHPSCKAIGAKELIAHLQGELALSDAIQTAKIQTKQFAKRQRTWFRSKMASWKKLQIDNPNCVAEL